MRGQGGREYFFSLLAHGRCSVNICLVNAPEKHNWSLVHLMRESFLAMLFGSHVSTADLTDGSRSSLSFHPSTQALAPSTYCFPIQVDFQTLFQAIETPPIQKASRNDRRGQMEDEIQPTIPSVFLF